MIRLAVFGGSGATGRVLLEWAQKKGIRAAALVRDGNLKSSDLFGAELVTGTLTDAAVVEKTLVGCNAVICVFGQRPPYKEIFCAQAMRVIIAGMEAQGVRRLVVQTGGMIGDYPENRTWFFTALTKLVRRQNPAMMRDREGQEVRVTMSALDWTIVKPPRLVNRQASGKYVAGPEVRLGLMSSLGREDLADFLITVAASNLHNREIVFVRNSRGLKAVTVEVPCEQKGQAFALAN